MQLAWKFPISLFLSMPNTYKFQIGSSFPPFSSLWAALGSPQIQHVVIVHVHAQSCLTLCDSMNCILLGSSVHGIFQAGILEWVAISSSRGSSHPRDRTHNIPCIAGRFFTAKPMEKPQNTLMLKQT